MTAEVDRALTDMVEDVFASFRGRRGGPAVADTDFWRRLDALGLVRLTGAEADGGSGAGWAEAAAVLHASAWHGVRVPLAEHDLLACWLLDTAGLPVDRARRTVCVMDGAGVAHDVPWASWVDRLVVVRRHGPAWDVAEFDVGDLDVEPGHNGAAEPRDQVRVPDRRGQEVSPDLVAGLRLRGALIRAVQVCAAMDRILELSVSHTRERTQFGRPIAAFQAVQHLVTDIATEATLARAATEAALDLAVTDGFAAPRLALQVAAARSCVGHAASVVVRNAHQVHGAIGTTEEHQLHTYTRAALAWRSEFGSVRYWDRLLTDAALAAGREGLWPLITP